MKDKKLVAGPSLVALLLTLQAKYKNTTGKKCSPIAHSRPVLAHWAGTGLTIYFFININ
jgi:hypothetical protein|tara:strand:- start:61 stop:237 length:177 start_codon:yes stop_codon:yes gene_type:complete